MQTCKGLRGDDFGLILGLSDNLLSGLLRFQPDRKRQLVSKLPEKLQLHRPKGVWTSCVDDQDPPLCFAGEEGNRDA